MRNKHYAVLAAIALVASFNLLLTSTARAAVPAATTLPASGVSNSVATLRGTVNPGGAATTAWFEWGFTANSQRTTNFTPGSGVVAVNLSQALTGLTAGATYRGRMVASNSVGLVRGWEAAFSSPTIALNGSATVSNYLNNPYVEPGFNSLGAPLAVAAGYSFNIALRCDGTIAAWGNSTFGQLNTPAGLNNVVAIAAGDVHNLGLLQDGTVVAWGNNTYAETNTPAGLSNVVAIAGGSAHSLALRSDGTLVAWGAGITNFGSTPNWGQSIIPAGLSNVVAIAAGNYHNLALRRDGTIVSWGDPFSQTNMPVGLSNMMAVAVGAYHNLALRSDGTVVSWGNNSSSQTNIPAGLSNVVAIAGGGNHSLALRNDGTVVAWGSNSAGQTNIPAGLSNVVAIAGGANHSLALRNDGTLVAWGDNTSGQTNIPGTLSQVLPVTISGNVNISVLGTNVLTYACTNVLGGVSRVTRTVFVVPPLVPSVTTLPASGIANGSATLNGTVNPNGAMTAVYFQYGLTTNYGSFSSTNSLLATNTPQSAASVISGLAPLTTYHFRAVANNSVGSVNGSNLTFTTSAFAPVVNTLPPSGVSNTVATLRATINPGAGATVAWFEWGTTPSVYSLRTTNRSVGSGVVPINLTQAITGLTAGMIYRGRVVASNSVGVVRGGDVLFGTPSVVLNGATTITNFLNSPYMEPGVSAVEGALAIAAGSSLSLALRSDTTVVGWGYNANGQANVPPGLSNVTAVAAGNNHGLALQSDGTVAAWGAGTNDTGAQPNYGQSIVPAGLSNVVAVAAGDFHSLALRSDGTVVSWGHNNYGQATVPAGLSNVVAIAGGQYHSLALENDGTIVVWGNSGFPIRVPAGLSNVVALAAGSSHSLALRTDGTVAAWGYNNEGQTNIPAGLSNVVTVAGGGSHSLALRSDGTVVAWGAGTSVGAYPDFGQSIVPAGLSNVTAIAGGETHSLALRSDGTVFGWGNPSWGQTSAPPSVYRSLSATPNVTVNTSVLGTYVLTYFITNSLGGISSVTRTVVVAPATPSVTTLPASGVSNTVARLNGTVNPGGAATTAWFEWGVTSSRYAFQTANLSLGNGGVSLNVTQALTGLTPGLIYHARLVASNSAGVMRGADVTFGSPSLVLNGGTPITNFLGEPYLDAGVSAVEGAVAIAAGDFHSLAVRGDGTVVAWGYNAYRQSEVPAGLSNVVAVAAGQYHSMALRNDGSIVMWGYSGFNITNVPAGLNDAVAISAGGNHSLALRSNGTVAAWGENSDGQSTVPAGLSNVVAIAAGSYHNVAVRRDGTVAAWGRNDYSQSTTNGFITDTVVAVAGGGFHSMALQKNGTIAAWGRNDDGQRNTPAALNGATVLAIGAGYFHSLAVRSDGLLVAWGEDGDGQSPAPAGMSNGVAVAGGQYHSVALQSDGSVVAWGANGSGQTNIPATLYRSLTVTSNGIVSTNVPGSYVQTYFATNGLGGFSSITRTVVVVRPLLPLVTTLPASVLSNGLATLNGTVNPNGAAAKAYFRYGLTTNYGSFSVTNFLTADSAPLTVANVITGLLPLTTYHFRLVATNSGGTTNGADLTFTTPSVPAITLPSAAVIATNAINGLRTVQLSAFVNPNGLATAVSFQYGLSANYVTTTSPLNLAASFSGSSVNTTVVLDPGVTWHWRVVASNVNGTNSSPDQTLNIGAPSGLAGDLNGDGVVSQSELNAVYANYVTNSPWLYMTNVAGLGGTNVSFALDNSVSAAYTVQYTTNLVNWYPLGPATPRYLFTDTNAPALPQRYYRLSYP